MVRFGRARGDWLCAVTLRRFLKETLHYGCGGDLINANGKRIRGVTRMNCPRSRFTSVLFFVLLAGQARAQ